MMSAIQLDFFSDPENVETQDLRETVTKVRKRLFAELGALKERVETLEQSIEELHFIMAHINR